MGKLARSDLVGIAAWNHLTALIVFSPIVVIFLKLNNRGGGFTRYSAIGTTVGSFRVIEEFRVPKIR